MQHQIAGAVGRLVGPPPNLFFGKPFQALEKRRQELLFEPRAPLPQADGGKCHVHPPAVFCAGLFFWLPRRLAPGLSFRHPMDGAALRLCARLPRLFHVSSPRFMARFNVGPACRVQPPEPSACHSRQSISAWPTRRNAALAAAASGALGQTLQTTGRHQSSPARIPLAGSPTRFGSLLCNHS